jgi:hypothetical protein
MKPPYYPKDQMEQYKRRAFEADVLKLTVAIVAELLIFLQRIHIAFFRKPF